MHMPRNRHGRFYLLTLNFFMFSSVFQCLYYYDFFKPRECEVLHKFIFFFAEGPNCILYFLRIFFVRMVSLLSL